MHITLNKHLKYSDSKIDKINLDIMPHTFENIWLYLVNIFVFTSSSANLWASSFLQNFALGPALGMSY